MDEGSYYISFPRARGAPRLNSQSPPASTSEHENGGKRNPKYRRSSAPFKGENRGANVPIISITHHNGESAPHRFPKTNPAEKKDRSDLYLKRPFWSPSEGHLPLTHVGITPQINTGLPCTHSVRVENGVPYWYQNQGVLITRCPQQPITTGRLHVMEKEKENIMGWKDIQRKSM